MDRHLHLTDDELALQYYGEMTDAADARASGHLDGCDQCRQQLARLQQVLALVDAGVPPKFDEGWQSRLWQRLEPALREERAPRLARQPLFAHSSPVTRRIAWGIMAAVLMLAAFVAGRMSTAVSPAARVATAAPPVVDRVLDADLGDHLDRAELALTAFLMQTDGSVVPAATEDLIAANRLYRATAMAIGSQDVVSVLDELERALIEMSAASPGTAEVDREAVREWMDSRDLLFKVRVMREALERQDSSL